MSTDAHTDTHTADEHRAIAAQKTQEAAESFERSDTDGFLSQWASGVSAEKHRLAAQIAENGGRHQFLALFDLEGNLVAAKDIPTRHGYAWGLLATPDTDADIVGWFNESKAQDPERRRATNAKKGYYVGKILAEAYADLAGSGTGLGGALSVHAVARRKDRGFSTDVVIVDNGH